MSELSVNGADSVLLRRLRLLSVIDALRKTGPQPLTVLARQTGLSRPIIQTLAEELTDLGWVASTAPTEPNGVGRPARVFRFRAESGSVAGLDIGAHAVTALVTDLDGEVHGRSRLAVSPAAPASERLQAAKSALAEACSAAGLQPRALLQVGVGSSGVIEHSGRVALSVALPGWTGVDIPAALADTVSCPVVVENDGRAATLAERWRGAGRDIDNLVYIHAGLRTGNGVIVDGRLLRGHTGAAGEIGALPASGWAEAPTHLLGFPGLDHDARPEQVAEFVFARAREGDQAALKATERYVRALAGGIAALVLTFDPELVVLGGGISRSSDLVLQQLAAELDRVCVRVPPLVASSLDSEWVVIGAVRVALDAVERRYFAPGGSEPLALAPTPTPLPA
ncbi:ROK family protein [Catenulispora pinisilvae]|uniref:ROK family protein n=1 Tax=Catenulispora pinisilvae TaxID=2705253 RepID=UPI0018917385|nr:ROK family protein [Catenulispora pinisilvae]